MKILTLGLMVAGLASTVNAGVYSIEVLPGHPTDRFTTMSSINDHGLVVGESFDGTMGSGPKRIVSYRRDVGLQVVVDNLSLDGLQHLPEVNNSGQIAYSHNLRSGVFSDLIRAYRYTPGLGSEELASPNPNRSYIPFNMNEGGDVVGLIANSDGYIQDDIIWRTGHDPEILGGVAVASITDDRTILGRAFLNATSTRGYVRRDGQSPVILTYPNDSGWAAQMNSQGQVLGGYDGHTWLWAPNLIDHTEIPINWGKLLNDGSVIGGQRWGTPSFLGIGKWSPEGGYEEITEMLDAEARSHGFDRWSFSDVNQRGEILARAWTDDPNIGREPRFNIILRPQPVPEPGTMLALGAGLAALLRRRRTT